jgi:hypothetical protein
VRRKEAALVLMALDASNLPLSLNIDDRRNENNVVNYPTQVQILASLLHGLLSRPPPPPLRHVDTWTGVDRRPQSAVHSRTRRPIHARHE